MGAGDSSSGVLLSDGRICKTVTEHAVPRHEMDMDESASGEGDVRWVWHFDLDPGAARAEALAPVRPTGQDLG